MNREQYIVVDNVQRLVLSPWPFEKQEYNCHLNADNPVPANTALSIENT